MIWSLKPIKLNGDLSKLELKNGWFNKSLIKGFFLLKAFSTYLLDSSCNLWSKVCILNKSWRKVLDTWPLSLEIILRAWYWIPDNFDWNADWNVNIL